MRLARLMPKRTLAGRLAMAVIGAVTAALVLTAALSVWREVNRYAEDKRAALDAVAQVFASGSARAVAENDGEAADATLRGIARIPNLVHATIQRLDGSVLAEQGIGLRLTRDMELDGQDDLSVLHMLRSRTLQAATAIRDNGRDVGRVLLVADTSDLADRLVNVALDAALAALLAIVIGLGVAQHLQGMVTRPLADLTTTMEAVRLHHDYSQRATVRGDDEVGALARTFNDLIGAVNQRDRSLAEHREHLEDEVRERTADLNEAKHSAEAANEAKSTFLATMSHEIRTPMNGVLVMAELLASSELPARQRRFAEVIARSGQSLLAIINDILDFAKVEAGKLELERVAVGPADIADTAVMLFAERARSAGLDLAASVAPDVPATILGDPVRLGQVVSNFVSNALKFTQAGHVAVRMEMDGTFLRIGVTDTGIGIPEDKIASIFSAFSQADQSTTRRFGGTGLGLSIAQRLVAAMGGTVGVDSRVGVGSTFWARIPVESDVAPQAAIRREASVAPEVTLRLAGGATRAALAATLQGAGFAPDAGAEGDAEGGAAHWILDAAALAALGRRPAGAARVIVLESIGDPAAQQAMRRGLADAALRWPVVQADLHPLLAALAAGTPFTTPEAGTAVAGESLPHFAGARVLVADDSAVNREVAIEALARCGVTDVVVAEDGAQAVALSAAGGIDLILMDGSMPVLDGFEATRAIRLRDAAAGARRMPIIALTAHVFGEGAEAWRRADMDGMLSKPFTLSQLAAVLDLHLSRSEATGREAPDAHAKSTQEIVSPNATEGTDLLDFETLDSLAGLGDRAFFDRVLQLYTQQAPAALAALKAAAAGSERSVLASAAHGLKSMSLNIGAIRLADRLAAIEQDARTGTLSPGPVDLEAIDDLFASTSKALTYYQRTLSAAA